jgi:ferredoxin/flavodoxin
MRIAILYFSGTGNTYWAAHKIAESLQGQGWDAQAISIETVDDKRLHEITEESEAVGIGYPIYGSDTPEPIKDLIERLPEGNGKQTLVFCTQWQFSGDGAMVAGRELRKKGYRIRWTLHIKMPNNVCVTAMPLPFTADYARLTPKLSRARKRIDKLVEHMVEGASFRWISSRLMGAMQRVPYRILYDKWRDLPSADTGRCNGCGRCARNCPVDNISIENGVARFHGKCVMCLRCYNFCPELAVRVYGKLHKDKRGRPYQGPTEGFMPEDIRK